MIDRHHLPNDVSALKGIIYQLLDVIEEQRRQITVLTHKVEEQKVVIEEQRRQITVLTHKVDRLTHQGKAHKRYRYGPRSESSGKDKTDQPVKRTPVAHGRQKLPDHLPRQYKDHSLESLLCTSCGKGLIKIGEVKSEQLEAVPLQLYVLEHRRAKYACRHCRERVVVADMPAQPIEKGLAGSGLLAEVLVSKYQDHLPLYRQSQRF